MKSLYTIIFKDNSNFLGGTLLETKWLQIPDKPIKRVIYSLPNGDNLVLNNYDKYFHFCEATTDLSGKNQGKTRLEYDYILGKKDKLIICYKITLFENSNHKIGDVEKIIFNEEDNFIKKLNKMGWK